MLAEMATWSYSVWLLSPMALFSGLGADEQRLTLLDMGKQQMVAIWQTQQGNFLIGTGGQVGRQHTMDSIVLPSLTRLGVDKLDAVVLTSDDAQSRVGLALLENRLTVGKVYNGSDCKGDTLAWQWKSDADVCWLYLTHQLALTWQQPTHRPDAVSSLVAPMAKGKSLDGMKPDFWLSPNTPAHDSWAKTVKGTRCSGAMTLSIKGDDMRLIQEYRLSDKRFYHGDCK